MKKSFLVFILPLVIFSFYTGCSKGSDSKSPVIANVNKGVITEEEFLKEAGRVPENARNLFEGTEGKDKFLDELIKRELIIQEAKRMRLQKDKEYMEKLRDFENMTLVSMILKKEIEEKARIDESEAKTFYEENKDKFTIGTELRASHILVETEKEASDILARINKGESFAELAKSLSKDKGSAPKGGDLGYFGRGKMVPEFEAAALSLKPGEVSKPVQTRFGFHLIKLADIKMGEHASFEQSKELISRQLLAQKQKKLFDSYIEGLQSKGKVNKNSEAIASIVLPWEEKMEDKPAEKEAGTK